MSARCLCQPDIGHLCDAHRRELESVIAPKRCCGGLGIASRGLVHVCDSRWMQPVQAHEVLR